MWIVLIEDCGTRSFTDRCDALALAMFVRADMNRNTAVVYCAGAKA